MIKFSGNLYETDDLLLSKFMKPNNIKSKSE